MLMYTIYLCYELAHSIQTQLCTHIQFKCTDVIVFKLFAGKKNVWKTAISGHFNATNALNSGFCL